MKNPFYVAPCDVGNGVFAHRKISAGQLIHRFSGRLLTRDEVIVRGEMTMNPLQISPILYVDLRFPGVMFNHSCNPNAGIRNDIFLHALRPIEKHEEIRFDYSTTMNERYETMNCACGHHSCRKIVGDFEVLPVPVRRRYLRLRVVQSFIHAQFGAR